MNDIEAKAEQGPRWGKLALPTLAGAVTGFLVAIAMLQLFRDEVFGELSASSTIAIAVAMVYIFIAVGVGVGLISPAFGARFLNVEDAEELREQRQSLMASGIGMLLLGAALFVLAISGPGGVVAPETAAIATALLVAVAVAATIRSARVSDELMRTVARETGNTGYYLIFGVVGGWAGLAHLQLVPAPAMLDVLTTIWALGLVAAFWVSGRRGMLNPR